MATTLKQLPSKILAGIRVDYTRTYADYSPGDGWGAKLLLRGASVADVVAVPDGPSFNFTILESVSTTLLPGLYKFQERVQLGDEKRMPSNGTVILEPDFETAGAGDLVEFAEVALALVRAAIKERCQDDQEMVEIGGTRVQKNDILKLTSLEKYYAGILALKKRRGRLPRSYVFRLGRAM